MTKILEMRARRARLWDAAKAFLDTHRAEDGTMTAEDSATYQRMEDEVINLGKEVERMERQAAIDAEMNLPVNRAITTRPDATVNAEANKPEKKGRQPAGKNSGSGARVNVSARAVETECDVRGMNLEEALLAVDMFLDGAVLNKLGQVYIIHGKGTGVLRNGIQQHLKKHPAIKSFRLGKYGEGEDGVTVATLK